MVVRISVLQIQTASSVSAKLRNVSSSPCILLIFRAGFQLFIPSGCAFIISVLQHKLVHCLWALRKDLFIIFVKFHV